MQNTHTEFLLPMESLPGSGKVDLSMAASVIQGELFEQIAQFITQIDLSLFGMRSAFNPQSACIAPQVAGAWPSPAAYADLAPNNSPIASAAGLDSIVVQTADFAS
ncbi:MAG TPA: hypothetical protein VFV39_03035 [Limnobacter sp.]|nr:hypothetical protein [Limnobacter sp.]